MKIKVLLMAVVLTGLLFSLSALAQTGCPEEEITDPACFSVPMTIASGQSYRGEIPKFDSSLGTLISARLTVRACAASTFEVDSEDPLEQTWHVVSQGNIVVTPPVGPELSVTAGTPDEGVEKITAPDDEPGLFNADFAGPDYFKLTTGTVDNPVCEEDDKEYDLPADLAVFNGIAGETLEVQMRLRANKDSGNENGSTYEERAAVLASGRVCVEYTYQPPCPRFCINGTKINDCTDEPISGWEICLSNSSGQIGCVETDENGEYSFCGLVPGDYQVTEETRAGWVPKDATSRDVTLGPDANDVDFRNAPPSCISGFKYNGTTDEGLSGWTITLKDANGVEIDSATTDADGYYEFCGLLPGTYTVSEVTKPNWTPIGPTSITVILACGNSVDNSFRNRLIPPPPVCGPGCPWFIKNELYNANCNEIKEVGADEGLLSNELFDNAVVLNPESITIDPKYGTITVEEDGSFVYDPTGATALRNGVYVIFKYAANNGLCDAKYLGIAKIQISCK